MQFNWSTLVLQAINLLILCWLLHRFLYRPVLAVIDARRAQVTGQLAAAAATESQARDELTDLSTQRSHLADERAAVLAAARAQADEAATARLAQADAQAAAMLAQARQAMTAERERALAAAKASTLDLAVAIARRFLSGLPPGLRAAAWLDMVTDQLSALPPLERQNLAGQLTGSEPLRVVTAAPLAASAATAWRERLGRILGTGIAIDFVVDPALLGGVDLRFPGTILRFSWKDALDALRTELENSDIPAGPASR